jgi:putative nucleotidyltransferase with HDIG domain
MSIGSPKRTRQQRVAAVELPPGFWKTLWMNLQRGAVLLRLAMCALAALFLLVFTHAWDPPFRHRLGEIPKRDLIARVDFERPDPDATNKARDEARRLAVAEYDQNPEPLVQLRGQLMSDVGKLAKAESLDKLDKADAEVWAKFQPPLAPGTPEPTPKEKADQFKQFRDAFAAEGALDALEDKLAEVMAPFEQRGLLDELPPEHDANVEKIFVRPKGSDTVAAQDKAAAAVPEVKKHFTKGKDVLAKAGEPLNEDTYPLLKSEYEADVARLTIGAKLQRSLAWLGMFVALYTLAGFFLFRRERRVLDELLRLAALLALFVLCVAAAAVLSQYAWASDVIPLLLFGMIVAIAYQQEMALLLTACVALVIVTSMGHVSGEALALIATAVGAILVLRQVRTRSRLFMVGFCAAAVGFFTTVGVGVLEERAWGPLLREGGTIALWSVIAGSLMTVLLPAVEKIFAVETDLSLIELGDPAHPLLQELIRRAPGSYNHSITVASLAEAAAEAIGARGLLIRVGAYFHDIGKMLKPGYFAENQTRGDNRHDSLVPAMSTLVISAHVKDGVDLARQNGLPESIIDFIQQHHGTTLVEYFYRQANQKKVQEDPEGGALDESSFRYPGPKPQSKEAGILMLADAVESASRVLKEPTPSRIENLVDDISMKRLLDGQFDECGLTLEEVRRIGESLVKSLTAVYHGRVKYPDQEIA